MSWFVARLVGQWGAPSRPERRLHPRYGFLAGDHTGEQGCLLVLLEAPVLSEVPEEVPARSDRNCRTEDLNHLLFRHLEDVGELA